MTVELHACRGESRSQNLIAAVPVPPELMVMTDWRDGAVAEAGFGGYRAGRWSWALTMKAAVYFRRIRGRCGKPSERVEDRRARDR